MQINETSVFQNTKFQANYSHKSELDGWKHFVWNCTLKTTRGEVQIPFKMGLAHVKKQINQSFPIPPKLKDVLFGLLCESEALHMSFEDWCGAFGYDSDSITAFNTYRACCESGKKLNLLFTKQEIQEIEEALRDY